MKSTNFSQFGVSALVVCAVAAACFPLTDWIGYRTVSLILMLAVSILALRMPIGPVFLAAVLSALIWDFFFIPPHFTFHVESAEDALMLLMFFIIALINGVLTQETKKIERIAQQKEDKEETLRLYNTLFNSISHEIKTPIATIWAASENLLTDENRWSNTDRKAMTEEIHVAAERLNRLVDNLLNMSRLESGQIILKWKWCDLHELINEVLKRLSPDLENRRVELRISEKMPLLRLDFNLLEQAIFNIVHNAVTYTPDGSVIEIEAQYGDNQLVMKILDNGYGFKNDDLDLVFEKFFRPLGSKAGGTGLGLSIARGFVEAHHGEISVKNRPTGGAEFLIKIPTGHLFKNQPAD